MQYIIEVLMAVVGAVAFSVIFNIHGKKLIITGIGGAITWSTYLLVYNFTNNVFVSCLLATIVIMFYTELMARVSKNPVIILLVPMLVPMVPGGDLYYMMANVVMDNSELGRFYGQKLVLEVGAIAFGIILVSTAIQIERRIRSYLLLNRK